MAAARSGLAVYDVLLALRSDFAAWYFRTCRADVGIASTRMLPAACPLRRPSPADVDPPPYPPAIPRPLPSCACRVSWGSPVWSSPES